ncbi:D-2-hydroxyacid dehydrogenase [Metabacillus malikii]|uniref:Phosphoglycerate dehydrogenase-like enzyme n=1 Tax=Metabacillus malikii TaxID=1504265 RepID=A0ABT9ZHM0_9BACI|nr:D-2-hydroxyacid dehydrogenase [Metabacillus malikii]MDQ0231767.1 phosphoglycerate dehydrogenase-like enzyme [Metabacillus malikii]
MQVLSTVKLSSELKEQLEAAFPETNVHHDRKIDEAIDILKEVDILFTYGEDINAKHIQIAKNLKWIMVASAGVDKLPFLEIKKRNIQVTNSKGVHAIPMAEYCLAMMLQVSRQTKTLIENQANHVWDRRVKMEELHGKTVYILGTGAIGQEIARISKAFHMNVIGMNGDGRQIDHFDSVYSYQNRNLPLSEVDFLISVLPSTNDTIGLIDMPMFEKMKKTITFINIGRGDVVKEDVLISALEKGYINHAVLDVFAIEPLPRDHPLWDMKNVTITPHLSGITKQYLPRVMPIFLENLKFYSQGECSNMINSINLDKQY